MNDLIQDFKFKIVEAGCAPVSGRYGVQIDTAEDIRSLFPYINALHRQARYDPQNKILIWRENDRAYALRSHEIKIVQPEGIDSLENVSKIVGSVIEEFNRVWREKETITPCFTEHRHLTVMDVFKLLPKTNCGKCGYRTCLAYAAALSGNETGLEACPAISDPRYTENRKELQQKLLTR